MGGESKKRKGIKKKHRRGKKSLGTKIDVGEKAKQHPTREKGDKGHLNLAWARNSGLLRHFCKEQDIRNVTSR